MFQTYDPVRINAYEKLLASPQPAGLPRGGQVHRWAGDPDRRVSRLPAIMMAWLQRRHLDTDVGEPLTARVRTFRRTPSVRTVNHGLHLLRPTGT